MNPDAVLDELAKTDNKPGQKTTPGGATPAAARASYKALFAVRDNAVRCVRRERSAVMKIAKRCANDPDGWSRELREFYGEHAQFVGDLMRISPIVSRGYAAQHGSELELKGFGVIDGEAGDEWEKFEADELAVLALSDVARMAA